MNKQLAVFNLGNSEKNYCKLALSVSNMDFIFVAYCWYYFTMVYSPFNGKQSLVCKNLGKMGIKNITHKSQLLWSASQFAIAYNV